MLKYYHYAQVLPLYSSITTILKFCQYTQVLPVYSKYYQYTQVLPVYSSITSILKYYHYTQVLPVYSSITSILKYYHYTQVLPVCSSITTMLKYYQYTQVLPLCSSITSILKYYQYTQVLPVYSSFVSILKRCSNIFTKVYFFIYFRKEKNNKTVESHPKSTKNSSFSDYQCFYVNRQFIIYHVIFHCHIVIKWCKKDWLPVTSVYILYHSSLVSSVSEFLLIQFK